MGSSRREDRHTLNTLIYADDQVLISKSEDKSQISANQLNTTANKTRTVIVVPSQFSDISVEFTHEIYVAQ